MNQGTEAGSVRVAVVDDHPAYRSAVVSAIESGGLSVQLSCGSVEELCERLPTSGVDVVVLDLRLPGLHGAAAVSAVTRLGVAVLVLSAQSDPRDVAAVVDAGARGYLTKDAAPDRIVDGVRAVARGENLRPPTPADVPCEPTATPTRSLLAALRARTSRRAAPAANGARGRPPGR